MDTTKEKAREEKIRQIQIAGAEAVLKAEKERLGIDIVPVFDEEKILLDCTLSDLTVIHLRTDYRNFTLGSPGIFRFIGMMNGNRDGIFPEEEDKDGQ